MGTRSKTTTVVRRHSHQNKRLTKYVWVGKQPTDRQWARMKQMLDDLGFICLGRWTTSPDVPHGPGKIDFLFMSATGDLHAKATLLAKRANLMMVMPTGTTQGAARKALQAAGLLDESMRPPNLTGVWDEDEAGLTNPVLKPDDVHACAVPGCTATVYALGARCSTHAEFAKAAPPAKNSKAEDGWDVWRAGSHVLCRPRGAAFGTAGRSGRPVLVRDTSDGSVDVFPSTSAAGRFIGVNSGDVFRYMKAGRPKDGFSMRYATFDEVMEKLPDTKHRTDLDRQTLKADKKSNVVLLHPNHPKKKTKQAKQNAARKRKRVTKEAEKAGPVETTNFPTGVRPAVSGKGWDVRVVMRDNDGAQRERRAKSVPGTVDDAIAERERLRGELKAVLDGEKEPTTASTRTAKHTPRSKAKPGTVDVNPAATAKAPARGVREKMREVMASGDTADRKLAKMEILMELLDEEQS